MFPGEELQPAVKRPLPRSLSTIRRPVPQGKGKASNKSSSIEPIF
jgi:hypothetical protein